MTSDTPSYIREPILRELADGLARYAANGGDNMASEHAWAVARLIRLCAGSFGVTAEDALYGVEAAVHFATQTAPIGTAESPAVLAAARLLVLKAGAKPGEHHLHFDDPEAAHD